MRNVNTRLVSIALGAAALTLLIGPRAFAARCGQQNPPRCGNDSEANPPDPNAGGCTEASLQNIPLFEGTHMCQPGFTPVIYDLSQPFPDNGLPGDQEQVGRKSFVVMRADPRGPCGHMVDTVDPKVCPDPKRCPDPMSPQPEGAIKAPVTGYLVICWSPPDKQGCRDLEMYTKNMCMHIQHQFLGSGCTMSKTGVDCPSVSTETVGITVPGGASRHMCPPPNTANSCRGVRQNGVPALRFWIGAVCTTNNCANPGVNPMVDPKKTCEAQWGATRLGYDLPHDRGIQEPGWYDWKTGAMRVTLNKGEPTCGDLGECLGVSRDWDVAIVAVPRPGQSVPCSGTSCDDPSCFAQ